MWLNGIIAIKNSNGESASPWNRPLWSLTSAKVLSAAVNSTIQFFMASGMNFKTYISCIFSGNQLSSFAGLYHRSFSSQSTSTFFRLAFFFLRISLSICRKSANPFVPMWRLFFSSGKRLQHTSKWEISSLIFHIIGRHVAGDSFFAGGGVFLDQCIFFFLEIISYDLSFQVVFSICLFFVSVYSSQYIPVCFSFLTTFVCCRNFFTCPSSQHVRRFSWYISK